MDIDDKKQGNQKIKTALKILKYIATFLLWPSILIRRCICQRDGCLVSVVLFSIQLTWLYFITIPFRLITYDDTIRNIPAPASEMVSAVTTVKTTESTTITKAITTKSTTQKITTPETEPASEPATEPATEPQTEPATEPATEPEPEPELKSEPERIKPQRVYWLNTESGKYHFESCRTIKDGTNESYWMSTTDIDWLKSNYTACKVCHPF